MAHSFSKPKSSGRKPSYQQRHQSLEPDFLNDRDMETETRTALEIGVFRTSIQGEETMFTDPRQFLKIISSFCHSTLLPSMSLSTH